MAKKKLIEAAGKLVPPITKTVEMVTQDEEPRIDEQVPAPSGKFLPTEDDHTGKAGWLTEQEHTAYGIERRESAMEINGETLDLPAVDSIIEWSSGNDEGLWDLTKDVADTLFIYPGDIARANIAHLFKLPIPDTAKVRMGNGMFTNLLLNEAIRTMPFEMKAGEGALTEEKAFGRIAGLFLPKSLLSLAGVSNQWIDESELEGVERTSDQPILLTVGETLGKNLMKLGYDTASVANLLWTDPWSYLGWAFNTTSKLYHGFASYKWKRNFTWDDDLIGSQNWRLAEGTKADHTRVAGYVFDPFGKKGRQFVTRMQGTIKRTPLQVDQFLKEYRFLPVKMEEGASLVKGKKVQDDVLQLTKDDANAIYSGNDIVGYWNAVRKWSKDVQEASQTLKQGGPVPLKGKPIISNLKERPYILILDGNNKIVARVPTKALRDGGPENIFKYLQERSADYNKYIMHQGKQLPLELHNKSVILDDITHLAEVTGKDLRELEKRREELSAKTRALKIQQGKTQAQVADKVVPRGKQLEEAVNIEVEAMETFTKDYLKKHGIDPVDAKNIIENFNLNPDMTASAAHIIVYQKTLVKELEHLQALAQQYMRTKHVDDYNQLLNQYGVTSSLSTAVMGIKGNIGRAEEILRISERADFAGDISAYTKKINEWLHRGREITPEVFAEKIAEAPNLLALSKAMNHTHKVGGFEMFVETMINGWLWGPTTWAINIVSSGLNSLHLLGERSWSSFLRFGQTPEIGKINAFIFGFRSAWAEFKAIGDGVRTGVKNAGEFARTGVPQIGHTYQDFRTATRQGAIPRLLTGANVRDLWGNSVLRRNMLTESLYRTTRFATLGGFGEPVRDWGARTAYGLVDWIGMGWRISGKIIGTTDEAVKGVNYKMMLSRYIHDEAVEASFKNIPDLSITDRLAHINMEIGRIGIDPIAYPRLEKFAKSKAPEATFTQNLGEMGQAFTKFANSHPAWRLLFPFIRTPSNLIKWNFHRTPILNRFTAAYQKGIASENIAERTLWQAREHAAIGLMVASITTVMEGKFVGRAPSDPELKKIWLAAGNVEDSFYNSKADVSYRLNRMDPFVMYMGTVADAVRLSSMVGEGRVTDFTTALFLATMSRMRDKFFLMSASDFMNLTDRSVGDKDQWDAVVRHVIPNMLIPGTPLFRAIGKEIDNVQRELNSVMDGAMQNVPGWSSGFGEHYRQLLGYDEFHLPGTPSYLGYPDPGEFGVKSEMSAAPLPLKARVDAWGYPNLFPVGISSDWGVTLDDTKPLIEQMPDGTPPLSWAFNAVLRVANPITYVPNLHPPHIQEQAKLLVDHELHITQPPDKMYGVELTVWEREFFERLLSKGLERMHQEGDISDAHYKILSKKLDAPELKWGTYELINHITQQSINFYQEKWKGDGSANPLNFPTYNPYFTDSQWGTGEGEKFEGKTRLDALKIAKQAQTTFPITKQWIDLPNHSEVPSAVTKQSILNTAISKHRKEVFDKSIPHIFLGTDRANREDSWEVRFAAKNNTPWQHPSKILGPPEDLGEPAFYPYAFMHPREQNPTWKQFKEYAASTFGISVN